MKLFTGPSKHAPQKVYVVVNVSRNLGLLCYYDIVLVAR